MLCTRCGATNERTANFCKKCGVPLKTQGVYQHTVVCPKCGSHEIQYTTATREHDDDLDACCGFLLFGFPGLLCGLFSDPQQSPTRRCRRCGYEF